MLTLSDKRNKIAKTLRVLADMLSSQMHDVDNSMIDCDLDAEVNIHEYNHKTCSKTITLKIQYEEDLK